MDRLQILQILLEGASVTVKIVLMALPPATIFAFGSGLMQLHSWRPLRWFARGYIEFFRGTSVLIQLYWIYFVLPFAGIELDAMTAGVTALSLHIGAYGAEVVRGAVIAVPRGQIEAAIALNFTPAQRMWRIILPQALVNMLPPFGNLAIELVKLTSLVSLITIAELTYKGKSLADLTLEVGKIFILVLLVYFVIAQCLAALIRLLERRLSRGLDRGGIQS